jgi:hypothetical protein
MSCSLKTMMGGRKRRASKRGGEDNVLVPDEEVYDELEMDTIPTGNLEETTSIEEVEPVMDTIQTSSMEEEQMGGKKRRTRKRRSSRKSKKQGMKRRTRRNKKHSKARKH